jgi:hypothetical protein
MLYFHFIISPQFTEIIAMLHQNVLTTNIGKGDPLLNLLTSNTLMVDSIVNPMGLKAYNFTITYALVASVRRYFNQICCFIIMS